MEKIKSSIVLPNFIIIGGQRCATGWIAQCLREHPEVFIAADETRFFDRHYSKGLSWYSDVFFNDCRNEQCIGEKTANYLFDEVVPERIYECVPEAQLIVCLRNPIERFFSAQMMMCRKDSSMRKKTLDELLANHPDMVRRGAYLEQLERYYKFFDKNKVLITFYDDKKSNPELFMSQIYQFLGVDLEFKATSLSIQTKPGAWENGHILLRKFSGMIFSKNSVVKPLMSKLRPKSTNMSMSLEEKNKLLGLFIPEIEKIERVTGRDLTVWKQV